MTLKNFIFEGTGNGSRLVVVVAAAVVVDFLTLRCDSK